MARVFGGQTGKAEEALRNREKQIEQAVGGSSTANEMHTVVPEGTTMHRQTGNGTGYQDTVTRRTKSKAAKAVQDWIDEGR